MDWEVETVAPWTEIQRCQDGVYENIQTLYQIWLIFVKKKQGRMCTMAPDFKILIMCVCVSWIQILLLWRLKFQGMK